MLRTLSIAAVSFLLLGPGRPAGATWIFAGEIPAAAFGALAWEGGVVSEAPAPALPPASGSLWLASEDPPSAGLGRALGFSAICRESDPVLESALSGALPLGDEMPGPADGPLLGDGGLP